MSDSLLDWVRMASSDLTRSIAANVSITAEDTLEALIHSLQIQGMRSKITDEYPGIFEAADTFESKSLRDALTLIKEGDFAQVSTGVNSFNTLLDDKLMDAFELERLSEQDKFTLAMLRGKV